MKQKKRRKTKELNIHPAICSYSEDGCKELLWATWYFRCASSSYVSHWSSYDGLSTDTPASKAACPELASRRGRHVIEFPTANLICTEMKLYGICLERSINCFLCFLGSHKYSSFGSWRDVDWVPRDGSCQLVILQLTALQQLQCPLTTAGLHTVQYLHSWMVCRFYETQPNRNQ